MDGVLVDLDAAIDRLDLEIVRYYKGRLAEIPGFFLSIEPIPDAIESFQILTAHFDTYILSTSTCENYAALGDRLQWMKKYLGESICQRLILTHHKHLNIGDYLIDAGIDRGVVGGASPTENRFIGEHIHFGSKRFPNWRSVLQYLINSPMP
jgi:5'-nucleotidase